ncbi:MAG: monomeric [Anaerolineaceae bacterium]|nr:monomeric [FeFe] hydrogenase [Anaerolineaceae bacterium]
MRIFDTSVQELKYKIMREIVREAWNNNLFEGVLDIPQMIVPGKKPTMRCCVYKERAIVAERVKLIIKPQNDCDRMIRSLEIACDECPADGYYVSESCRGCLSHHCVDVCKRKAISFQHGRGAFIDRTMCVNCGQCAQVCPFSAIVNRRRPCQNACKVDAITSSAEGFAKINHNKCTGCGACVYQCPFGAIVDRSHILGVVQMLKDRAAGNEQKICAVLAPAISSQFTYASLGQVISGLREMGFDMVVEAAHGADMVAKAEAAELAEKGFLISSCCPAFVRFVQNNYPDLAPNISHSLSPMATIAKRIKEANPGVKVVFFGPCTAKKEEIQLEKVRPYVDYVLTFEELQALYDGLDINIITLDDSEMDDTSSYYGRIFARCGGLAEAVQQSLKEQGFTDFQLKPVSCDGLDACKLTLIRKSHGRLDANFIEGMACVGGCIGGAGCLTHAAQSRNLVDKYGKAAGNLSIVESAENPPERG